MAIDTTNTLLSNGKENQDEDAVMYIYRSHIGNRLYMQKEYSKPHYCDDCDDYDVYLGKVNSKEEVELLLKEAGYKKEKISAFISNIFERS